LNDTLGSQNLSQNGIKKRVLIQIDNPIQNFDELTKLFEQFGIELDKEYGLIPINPLLHQYVARGFGDSKAILQLKQKAGIKVFSDPDIKPDDNGNSESVAI
jgi:hypothetical protein